MECKSKRKLCYLSRRILATSKFVSRRRAVFISIQRSYSSPIYILFLFNLSIRCFFVSFSDRIAQYTLRTWLQFLCLRHFHLYWMSSNLRSIAYDLHYCPGSKNYRRQNKMMFSPELYIVALKKWMVYVLYIFNLYIYQKFLENWK